MTVANALTLIRMLLIPIFINALLYGRPAMALGAFTVAGVTDMLDGALARWLSQSSRLGEYLDPAADKLLLVSAFVVLSIPGVAVHHHVPIWLCSLVVARDVIIVTSAAVIYLTSGNVQFRPTFLGKLSTGTQVGTVFLLLFFNMLGRDHWLVSTALYATLATTLGSGFHYIYFARRLVERPVLRGTEATDSEARTGRA